jgi:hypothetical protein
MYNISMARRRLPERKNNAGETIIGAKTGKSARPIQSLPSRFLQ